MANITLFYCISPSGINSDYKSAFTSEIFYLYLHISHSIDDQFIHFLHCQTLVQKFNASKKDFWLFFFFSSSSVVMYNQYAIPGGGFLLSATH